MKVDENETHLKNNGVWGQVPSGVVGPRPTVLNSSTPQRNPDCENGTRINLAVEPQAAVVHPHRRVGNGKP